MKPTFELMAPQWIAFPAYTEFTIGWRMGAGEDYKSKFWDWYESLTPAQQKEFRFGNPKALISILKRPLSIRQRSSSLFSFGNPMQR